MKQSTLILLCTFLYLHAFSQSSTVSAGDWDNGGNWTDGVPGEVENATIDHDMTVNTELIVDGSAIWTINSTATDGGAGYNVTLKSNADLQINADFTISGDFKISNFANLDINPCATFTVGNMEVENNTTIFIDECAKLVVNGNLLVKNDIGIVCNGTICVNGDVTAENSATITGTGTLTATGTIEIKDEAGIEFSTPLPIKLLHFNALLDEKEKHVVLDWATATEINTSHFIIERSANGMNWDAILKTPAAENSSVRIDYKELDRSPLIGISYYRLVQVDLDGEQEIFDPVAVNNNTFYADDRLTAFPNPNNSDQIAVFVPGQSKRMVTVNLFSVQGKTVFSQNLTLTDSGMVYIELPERPSAGVYLLKIDDYVTKVVWR